MARQYQIGQNIPDPLSQGLEALRQGLAARADRQQRAEEARLARALEERRLKVTERGQDLQYGPRDFSLALLNTLPETAAAPYKELSQAQAPKRATDDLVSNSSLFGFGDKGEEYSPDYRQIQGTVRLSQDEGDVLKELVKSYNTKKATDKKLYPVGYLADAAGYKLDPKVDREQLMDASEAAALFKVNEQKKENRLVRLGDVADAQGISIAPRLRDLMVTEAQVDKWLPKRSAEKSPPSQGFLAGLEQYKAGKISLPQLAGLASNETDVGLYTRERIEAGQDTRQEKGFKNNFFGKIFDRNAKVEDREDQQAFLGEQGDKNRAVTVGGQQLTAKTAENAQAIAARNAAVNEQRLAIEQDKFAQGIKNDEVSADFNKYFTEVMAGVRDINDNPVAPRTDREVENMRFLQEVKKENWWMSPGAQDAAFERTGIKPQSRADAELVRAIIVANGQEAARNDANKRADTSNYNQIVKDFRDKLGDSIKKDLEVYGTTQKTLALIRSGKANASQIVQMVQTVNEQGSRPTDKDFDNNAPDLSWSARAKRWWQAATENKTPPGTAAEQAAIAAIAERAVLDAIARKNQRALGGVRSQLATAGLQDRYPGDQEMLLQLMAAAPEPLNADAVAQEFQERAAKEPGILESMFPRNKPRGRLAPKSSQPGQQPQASQQPKPNLQVGDVSDTQIRIDAIEQVKAGKSLQDINRRIEEINKANGRNIKPITNSDLRINR